MRPIPMMSFLLAIAASAACGDRAQVCFENCGTPIPTTLMTVAAAHDDTVRALLLAPLAPQVGQNQLYYRFSELDTDTNILSASVTSAPQMTMGATVHFCPTSAPAPTADADGLFGVKVVFTMPTAADGTWATKVQMTPAGGQAHAFTFEPVVVDASDAVTTFNDNGIDFVVSLLFGEGAVHVGKNPFTLTVHALQPDQSYAPIDDAEILVKPLMVTMGHGSTGNRNPELAADGAYDGLVNLSMGGRWDIAFEIQRAGALIGTVHYIVEP